MFAYGPRERERERQREGDSFGKSVSCFQLVHKHRALHADSRSETRSLAKGRGEGAQTNERNCSWHGDVSGVSLVGKDGLVSE